MLIIWIARRPFLSDATSEGNDYIAFHDQRTVALETIQGATSARNKRTVPTDLE
jgi:hypothetical protein